MHIGRPSGGGNRCFGPNRSDAKVVIFALYPIKLQSDQRGKRWLSSRSRSIKRAVCGMKARAGTDRVSQEKG